MFNTEIRLVMKQMFLFFLVIVCFACCKVYCQDSTTYHRHDGLSLSLGIGGIGGDINQVDITRDYRNVTRINSTYSGLGLSIDLKAGFALFENIIVSFDFVNNVLFDVKAKYSSRKIKATEYSVKEMLLGAGITYYQMPWNIFVSGTLGEVHYNYYNVDKDFSSPHGIGYMFKIGKEWWVSANWGIGFSLGINGTNLEDDNFESSSTRYFLMLNATFN